MCLSGTMTLDPWFSTKWVVGRRIALYSLFPTGGVPAAALQLVAHDTTWAFSAVDGADAGAGLSPWSHYYVQAGVTFRVGDAGPLHVANAIVGPLTVPSSGAPIAIQVRPVQLELLESRGPGGSLAVDYALAHVFDPATGDEVSGAAVSLAVGGSSTTLSWTPALPGGAGAGYLATFSSPPAAQPTYKVTTTYPAGVDAGEYTLVADPPAFDGTVTAMSSSAGAPVNVSWSAEPQADYEVVEIYRSEADGGIAPTPAYISSLPDSPDATSETIGGGVLAAGSYLVNVAYAKANCPASVADASAAGCVIAESVAGQNLTVP
jgi:hypothetical protein